MLGFVLPLVFFSPSLSSSFSSFFPFCASLLFSLPPSLSPLSPSFLFLSYQAILNNTDSTDADYPLLDG